VYKWLCRKIVIEYLGGVPKENSNNTQKRIDELSDDFKKQINYLLFKRCLPYFVVASIIILYMSWINGAIKISEYSSAVDLMFVFGNASLLIVQVIAPISRRSEKSSSQTQATFFLTYLDKFQKISKPMNIAQMTDTFKEFIENEYDRFWAAKKDELRGHATRIVNFLMFFALNMPIFYYKQNFILQQQAASAKNIVDFSKQIMDIYSNMTILKNAVDQLQQTVSTLL